jgi:hypothetical protein
MQITWLTSFLDTPDADFEARAGFWSAITGWHLSPLRGEHSEFATLVPPRGDALLRVQRIDEGPPGVHIDLHVDSLSEVADAALGLGARQIADRGHRVMRSPAGLPFCLVADRGESTFPDVLDGGVPHRIDHVSIDTPAPLFNAEVDFWKALTGWSIRSLSFPEFLVLEAPARMPVGILVQRLGSDDVATSARAHIDVAAGTGVAALVTRHIELGARRTNDFDYWTVLEDPAGYPYCITASDPLR